jgi:hypothetical protein
VPPKVYLHEKRPLGWSSGVQIVLTCVGVVLGDSPYLLSVASFLGAVADSVRIDGIPVTTRNHCFADLSVQVKLFPICAKLSSGGLGIERV